MKSRRRSQVLTWETEISHETQKKGLPSRLSSGSGDGDVLTPTPDEWPEPLGLIRPWGYSSYDDYDVITVHGLRDDHRVVWTSLDGSPWLRDHLFKGRNIRQLDYRFVLDDIASVFRAGGIEAEARNLIRRYHDYRQNLEPTETERPIIWVCHDVGGTIVKQVLIEAARAIEPGGNENVETWEGLKQTCRKISTHSTATIFLGASHSTESIDTVQLELYTLMGGPEPGVKPDIMSKIGTLAHQVHKINHQFLETRSFNRLAKFFICFLTKEKNLDIQNDDLNVPLLTGPEAAEKEYGDDERGFDYLHNFDNVQSKAEDNWNRRDADQDSINEMKVSRERQLRKGQCSNPKPIRMIPQTKLWMQFPESSFSQFPTKTCIPFSFYVRKDQEHHHHAELVRGYEAKNRGFAWVAALTQWFHINTLASKIYVDLIRLQIALLSLVPPIRLVKVHKVPDVFDAQRLPFIDWLIQNEKYTYFNASGRPRLLHIEGDGGSASRSSMLSQYIAAFCEEENQRSQQFTFYFEFDKFDHRYNSIRAMLLTFINEISWRDPPKLHPSETRQVLESLDGRDNYSCVTLPDLFTLFTDIRRSPKAASVVIFLACFDSCLEEERIWFLTHVLEQQSRTDLNYKVILTTSGPDSFLNQAVNDSQRLRLAEFSKELRGYAIDEKDFDSSRLGLCLRDTLERRPILGDVKKDLEELVTECQAAPHLGYRILDWLGHFKRGRPIAEIAATVASLRPVTPQNVLRTFVVSLPEEKREVAISICRWVRYAVEPLTIEELSHALIVSTTSENLPLLDIDCEKLSEDIREMFGGIVQRVDLDIKFSHESFYTIFPSKVETTDDQQPSFDHGLLAEACLKYLMRDDVQKNYAKLSLDNFESDPLFSPLVLPREDFLSYAVRFWPIHYQLSDGNRPFGLAMQFFQSHDSRKARLKWNEAYYLLSSPFTRIHRSYVSTMPVIASLGLDDILTQQIESEKEAAHFQQDVWLAITEAARHGHAEIVRKLLNHVKAEEPRLQDAVTWSVFTGNDEVVSILLDSINCLKSFRWPRSVVFRAAAAGFDSLMLTISKAGGNIEEPNPSKGNATPLHTAIYWRQEPVVKVLIESKVSLSARDHLGRTPLQLAIEVGDPMVVQRLLDAKARLDDRDGEGVSVVNKAILKGEHAALKLLLEAGAEFKSGEFETHKLSFLPPINFAASCIRHDCIRLLIEHGVDLETECADGTPLYVLCDQVECMDTIELLLENGALTNKIYPDKQMLIKRALRTNNKKLIGLLIDKGAQLNVGEEWEDEVFQTPLTFAIDNCTVGMVKYLLERGASVNYIPGKGADSPLFVSAFSSSDIEEAKLLLHRKADLHWKREDGWGPLHAAYDMPAFVSLFLSNGADINSLSSCGTVLMMAARWNFPETVKVLLAHEAPRADLEAKLTWDQDDEDYNSTALQIAINHGNYRCANLLIKAGAHLDGSLYNIRLILQRDHGDDDRALQSIVERCLAQGATANRVEDNGDTVLHGMSKFAWVSVIRILLDSGAPDDAENDSGMTPLAVAVEKGKIGVTLFLLWRGNRRNFKNAPFGTLFHLAHNDPDVPDDRVLSVVTALFDQGADPTQPGPEPECESFLCSVAGRTDYSEYRKRKLIAYLIETAHVDPNQSSGNGRRYPLIVAAWKQDCDLMEYLIQHGADPNSADSQGRRAIHYVAGMISDSPRILRVLANAGADFQAADNFGRTPLHLAAGYGYLAMFQLLIDKLPKRFDINVRDRDGWTPLMWACKLDESNCNVVEELVKLNADVCIKSIDCEWSALKLARFRNMSDKTQKLLTPPEDQGERVGKDGITEVWDPDGRIEPPVRFGPGFQCDSCLLKSRSPRYICKSCKQGTSLCFKCFSYRKEVHDPQHEFEDFDAKWSKIQSRSQASRANTRGSHALPDRDGDPSIGPSSSAENTETESEGEDNEYNDSGGDDDDDDDDASD